MIEAVRQNIADNMRRMFKARNGFASTATTQKIMWWYDEWKDLSTVEERDDQILDDMLNHHNVK